MAFVNCAVAQVEYVITNKDFTKKNVSKTMELHFYKGEIYPVTQNLNGITYQFKVDTSEFRGNDNIDKLTTIPIDISSDKDKFIKIIKKNDAFLDDLIRVDLNSLSNITDTIWFVPETGDRIPFVNKKTDNISTAKAGKKFRLIIPNTITIWYNTDKLTEFTPKSTDWKLIIIIVGVVIGIVGLFLFGKSPKYITQKEPIPARYTSDKSLSKFAKKHKVKLKDLLKWNNIKPTFDSAQNRIKIKRELNEKDLIVGYKIIKIEQTEPIPTDDGGGINPTDVSTTPNTEISSSANSLSEREAALALLLADLKIDNKTITNENLERTKKIEELTKNVAEAKSRISKLEVEKSESDKNVEILQSEKSYLEQKIGTLNDKVKAFSTIIDKVITVDFMKDYANAVYEYLKICDTVVNEAFKCYDSVNQQSISQGLLLTNFQTAVCSLPVGKWMQIVSEIKNQGIVVSDNRLRKSLLVPVKNEEKQKEFQRMLFSEILVRYSNNVLILAEAFSNLSRFHLGSDSIIKIETTFKKHFEMIMSSAKSVELEIKPAHLFMNIDDFRDIEAIAGEKSLPYANIEGLQKDAIVKIVSYGVKTRFENTKTKIILT
jgi:LysM repeat protein